MIQTYQFVCILIILNSHSICTTGCIPCLTRPGTTFSLAWIDRIISQNRLIVEWQLSKGHQNRCIEHDPDYHLPWSSPSGLPAVFLLLPERVLDIQDSVGCDQIYVGRVMENWTDPEQPQSLGLSYLRWCRIAYLVQVSSVYYGTSCYCILTCPTGNLRTGSTISLGARLGSWLRKHKPWTGAMGRGIWCMHGVSLGGTRQFSCSLHCMGVLTAWGTLTFPFGLLSRATELKVNCHSVRYINKQSGKKNKVKVTVDCSSLMSSMLSLSSSDSGPKLLKSLISSRTYWLWSARVAYFNVFFDSLLRASLSEGGVSSSG